MIREYPTLTADELSRQGETWIQCDHHAHTDPAWNDAKFVTVDMVGLKDDRALDPSGEWVAGDVGRSLERGTLAAASEPVGEPCTATVRIDGIETITRQEGRRTIIETTALMPEGWVTSDPDDNPLNGAADFCPEHAHCVTTEAQMRDEALRQGLADVGVPEPVHVEGEDAIRPRRRSS